MQNTKAPDDPCTHLINKLTGKYGCTNVHLGLRNPKTNCKLKATEGMYVKEYPLQGISPTPGDTTSCTAYFYRSIRDENNDSYELQSNGQLQVFRSDNFGQACFAYVDRIFCPGDGPHVPKKTIKPVVKNISINGTPMTLPSYGPQ